LAANAAAELRSLEAKVLNSAATVRLTALEGLRAIGLGIASKAQAVYNAALAAAPMAAAIALVVGLGIAIYSLTQANNTASEAAKRYNAIMEDATIKRRNEAEKIKEYLALAKDASLTDEQRAKAIKKLTELSPEFLGGLNAANVATKEASRLINDYLTALDRKAIGELAYAEKSENIRRIIELQTKRRGAIDNFEFLGSSLSNFIKAPFSKDVNLTTNNEDDVTQIVNQKVKELETANKLIDSKYGNLIKEFQLKGLGDDEPAVKASTKRTEAFIKAKIKALEDEKAAYDIHSKEYKKYTQEIQALNDELANANGKLTKKQKADQTERLTALKEIEKAEIKAKQRSLTDTGEKLQRAKDDADRLRTLAKKGGLGAGAFTRITEIERVTTGTVNYEADTEKLLKELNKQKELYQNYEDYKTTVSKSAADTRYKQQLAEFENYGDYLDSLINPLFTKAQGGGLTGQEQDRLNKLLEQQKAYNTEVTNLEAKKYSDAYNSTISANQKIVNAEIEYQKQVTQLGENANKDQLANALLIRNQKIDAARDEAYKKTEIYRKLSADIIEMSRSEAKSQIEVIENILKTAKNLSPEVRNALAEQLKYAKEIVELGSGSAFVKELESQKAAIEDIIKTQKLSNEQLAEYKRQLDEITAKLKDKTGAGKFAEGLSKGFSEIGGAVSNLGAALEDTNPELAYALGSLGDIAKVGADAAGAFASFSSGDIIGGITKTIGATQIDSAFKDTLARLQAQDQGQITGSTYKHGTLLRKAKTTYQYAGLSGLNYDQLEELYTTNKLTDGAKALFEELKKLKDEGENVADALLEAGVAAAQLATGTTIENLSTNIISQLRAGKSGLKNVMDDYTSIIQEALLSTFKSDVVDVEMKAFYDRLSALAQSDGELTDEEIKTAQDDYIATRERIKKAFEDREKITGVSLTDPLATQDNGISGEVKSLQQDTGIAIEGLMRVSSGNDQLLKLPKSKEPYSYDWGGQNGKEYDLTNRFFEDKNVTFSGHILADSKADFWSKYISLWNVLKSAGLRSIYSTELEQTFNGFYTEMNSAERFTRLQEYPDSVAVAVEITFQLVYSEILPPDPGSNNSFPYTFPFTLS
nr:hypothetical protein [Tanacetum cinerariifolium]